MVALARGLSWGRRTTASELRSWRGRAAAIPNGSIRQDALEAIDKKRDNVEGASLFSILPKHRDRRLLRLLVAYQVMWDFLDSVSERGARTGQENGRQLHRALVEALDPGAPISDYYLYHPWKDDGGYLLALVTACRSACSELPSYGQVRSLVLDSVERCAVQCLNHEHDSERRHTAMKEWAKRELHREESGLSWFELTAAAGACMPHALLALAAEPSCERKETEAVYRTYFPWVSLAISMLDSYVDREEDAANGDHSYLAYYPTESAAFERLIEIIRRIVSDAASLPHKHRHTVLIGGVVATYLTTNAANAPSARAVTRELGRAGGPLTRMLLPIARVWRATRSCGLRGDRRCGPPPGAPLPKAVLTYTYWRWPLRYMEVCRDRYGKQFTHRMTSFPRLVFLSDPSEIRQMLGAPADVLCPGRGGAKISPIVGESSFMLLEGEEHLAGRRSIAPAFQRRLVARESDWVASIVRRTVSSWPPDIALPLHSHLRKLTLEVVLRRIFARRELDLEDRLITLRDRVLAMLDVTGSVVFPVPALRHGLGRSTWLRFQQDRADTDELIHDLIAQRRGRPDRGAEDALGTLMAARNIDGSSMSEQQLRDNVMSLILAGHETTASQLAWAFQLLAHNPTVQRRLIDEVDENGGGEYLHATIQEVLRHRPVFLFSIPRAVIQPIEIGGRTYEPPVHLLGCIYLLHHDPVIYPEPDEFRPERFLEGQPSPYTWMPWGGGRKRCPGSHLALLEMKTVLRIVLERMTIAPASARMERPRWRSVIVTPHAGSRVVLRRREPRLTDRRLPPARAYDRCPVRVRQASGKPIRSNMDFSQNI